MKVHEFTVLFPFGGIGGGAMGFLDTEVTLFGQTGRFRSIGGIDIDDAASRDFAYLTKSPSLTANIAELVPEQLRDFAGAKAPDVVFLSAPCVGSSKLISDAKAQEPKYRALNKLSEVWIDLMLATWGKSPPGLVLFENVPNMTTRAKAMLGRVKKALRAAGYVLHDGYHCAGELGGLAQRRRRWLMVARHAATVPPLLYQPTKKRVRGCGEVIGPLPMPGDPAGGAMHTLPKISWLNWVRLALIPAGGDWRDLPGVLEDGQKRREKFKRHEVCAWEKPCGKHASGIIADERVGPASAFKNVLRVVPFEQPAGTVTGACSPSNGAACVADPRVGVVPKSPPFDAAYSVLRMSDPSRTIAGGSAVGQGAYAVADDRVLGGPRNAEDAGGTVLVEGSEGDRHRELLAMDGSDRPARLRLPRLTNEGSKRRAPGHPSSPPSVDDNRRSDTGGDGRSPRMRQPAMCSAGTRSSSPGHSPPEHARDGAPQSCGEGVEKAEHEARKRGVPVDLRIDGAGSCSRETVRSLPADDLRHSKGTHATDGHWPSHSTAAGFLDWRAAAKTITGAARLDNGPFAIADTRIPNPVPLCIVHDVKKAPVGGVPIILAEDGTWHRPLTTLELAALQGFPTVIDGAPLKLAGTNATEWRRRIGNAVPPPAAKAIAERMLTNLLAARSGAFLLDGSGAVWVAPKKTRGKVDERARVRVGPRALQRMEREALIGANV